MIETSATIVALTGAILKVQGSVDSVKKDKANPHFKSRYATLENVIDTARPALQEAGIAFVQAPGQVLDGSVEVTTMLVHESGEWMRSTLHVPLGKRDAQGVGSAITYGCRYSLMAMLGLPPTDDDDGHAARPQPPVKETHDPHTGEIDPPAKSSAQLKRDGDWQKMMLELSVAIHDCKTLVSLGRLRAELRDSARKQGWNSAFKMALKDELDAHEDRLTRETEKQFDAETDASAIDQRMRDERAALAKHPVNGG
jgi:hypothetical protein